MTMKPVRKGPIPLDISTNSLAHAILNHVAKNTGIPIAAMRSSHCGKRTTRARRLAYLMLNLQFANVAAIGRYFERDARTVHPAINDATPSEFVTARRWWGAVLHTDKRALVIEHFERLEETNIAHSMGSI